MRWSIPQRIAREEDVRAWRRTQCAYRRARRRRVRIFDAILTGLSLITIGAFTGAWLVYRIAAHASF